MSEADVIRKAFVQDTQLCDRISDAAKQNRDQLQLFVDIARYVLGQSSKRPEETQVGPQAKKRRIDGSAATTSSATATPQQWIDQKAFFSATDISFSIPSRKKLTMEFVMRDPISPQKGGIRVIDPKTGNLEFGIDWADIEHVFCIPVPEKAQRQHNFVLFSRNPLVAGTSYGEPIPDQIVFTVPETAPKTITFGPEYVPSDDDTYVTATGRCMNSRLASWGTRILFPDENEFASAIAQSHRKGEKAYHVKAHRGSKDGYLFFLSCGILWAFKKPLALYTFDAIESISYTSVSQRTFNLVITVPPAGPEEQAQEVEFSMLDQADFAGIDEYIKRHGSNDASMAADRRAKRLNINPPKPKEETNGHVEVGQDGEDEETEMQKAERQLQDEEDDEEEDYDPGSEGESEGSGSDSEEEGGEGDGGDEGEEGNEMDEDDLEGPEEDE